MTREYWNKVARNYESEILSVFDCDAEGRVCACIETAAKAFPQGRSADLGCGVGKFTPVLAANFREVEACDFSSESLGRAENSNTELDIINFHQVDFTTDRMPFEPVELALCVNVLMMADMDQRLRAWRSVTNQVVEGGYLILVVPSLESIVMHRHYEVEQHLEEGCSCEEALERSLPDHSGTLALHQGVHELDGQSTKHYLKEELVDMLKAHCFIAEDIQRLRYRNPDSGEPLGSWDWLVMARRAS